MNRNYSNYRKKSGFRRGYGKSYTGYRKRKYISRYPLYKSPQIGGVKGTPVVMTHLATYSYFQLQYRPIIYFTRCNVRTIPRGWTDTWSYLAGGTQPTLDSKLLDCNTINHEMLLMRYQDVYLSKIEFEFIPGPDSPFPI